MSKESRKEMKEAQERDRERAVEMKEAREREAEAKYYRLQAFKENRDPIYNFIYLEIVKIRKWVAFMGIMIILSLIGGIIILISTAALTL